MCCLINKPFSSSRLTWPISLLNTLVNILPHPLPHGALTHLARLHSSNMASKNVNKSRGRPKGSKNKQNAALPLSQNMVAANYTLEELCEKRRRLVSLDTGKGLNFEPAFAASPAKRPATRSSQGVTLGELAASSGSSYAPNPDHSSPLVLGSSDQSLSALLTKDHLPLTQSDIATNSASTTPVENQGACPHSDTLLQCLLDRFDGVECKLSKLDYMEKQLSKLDAIESKTDNLSQDMRHMQGFIDSLRGEVETVKNKAKSTEEKLEREVTALKAQLKAQETSMRNLEGEVEERILAKTRQHFNEFTQHIEYAFIREQAAARKLNLIFTGIPENDRVPDIAKIRNIASSVLKINKLSIVSAQRMGMKNDLSSRPRPILVRFESVPDRARVWQAKKLLQHGPGSNIWMQEDMPKTLKEDLRVLLMVAKHASTIDKEEYKSIKVREFRLHYNGKTYSPAELETLPYDLRPSTICTTWTDDAVAFFGRFSPLSNHHLSPFIINDTQFHNVEQYLAVAKARLSGDVEILERALSCSNPADCKGILNALKDDHVQEWEEARAPVLMKALRGKYGQNKHLGAYLRSTFPRRLGEASKDSVWGIGLELKDKNVTQHSSWHPGANLLGRSLMTVRDELIRDFNNT